MDNKYYTEAKESITLMRLNKMCKDSYYEYFNKYHRCINFVEKLHIFLGICAKIFKNGFKKTFLKIFWTLFPKKITNYELKYNFEDNREFLPLTNGFDDPPKIVVYTSVFGNYDKIPEPLFVNDQIKFIAITDQEISDGSVWEKFDTTILDGFDKLDAYHKSKFCKLNPHVLFPTYDYSIWVDGNVQIVADIYPLILKLENHFMGTYRNPVHDDIYTEGRFCIYHDAVKIKDVNYQLSKYKKEGFPEHFGMREFSIIVREHNNEKCIDLMEQWWKEVNTYTMRDQLSFPYLLWKNNLPIDTIQLLGDNWRDNPRFIANAHKQTHSTLLKKL